MDEQAELQVPDLLLLDIQLPGESGYSIAQRYLRAMPSLRVIMMSVLNKQHDVLTGYNSGAMLYLAKPFRPETLVACLKGVFGSLANEDPEESQELYLTVASQTLSHQGITVQLIERSESVIIFSIALPRSGGIPRAYVSSRSRLGKFPKKYAGNFYQPHA